MKLDPVTAAKRRVEMEQWLKGLDNDMLEGALEQALWMLKAAAEEWLERRKDREPEQNLNLHSLCARIEGYQRLLDNDEL